MSELKFACPVCGQHITCAASLVGSQMDCPTCFRKLVVPHASPNGGSKLLLTATEAGQRPATSVADQTASIRPARYRPWLTTTVGVLLLFALVAGGMVLRERLLNPVPDSESNRALDSKATTAPVRHRNWTLNLSEARVPESPLTGRINSSPFTPTRVTLQGGTLSFRQGAKGPPELGVTIQLFARQAEDLARQTVKIEATRPTAPKLTLRWKDDQGKPTNRVLHSGYALRLEFGPVKNERLPGKIYLSTPDEAHSWVAGTFEAEIRKPQPVKQKP